MNKLLLEIKSWQDRVNVKKSEALRHFRHLYRIRQKDVARHYGRNANQSVISKIENGLKPLTPTVMTAYNNAALEAVALRESRSKPKPN